MLRFCRYRCCTCLVGTELIPAMDRLFFWDSIHAFKCLTVSFPAKLCTDFLARERGAPVYSVWASSWRTWMANYLRSQGLSYASILDFGSSVINLFRRWAWCQKTCHYQYYHSYSNYSSSYSSHSSWIFLWFPGNSQDFIYDVYIQNSWHLVHDETQQRSAPDTGLAGLDLPWLSWLLRCHTVVGSFENGEMVVNNG